MPRANRSLSVGTAHEPSEQDIAGFGQMLVGRKTYFVYAGAANLIKIGSSDDPVRRFTELRLISPVPLRVLGVVADERYPERELHERFNHLRCHGEWFHATADLRKQINAMLFCAAFEVLKHAIDEAAIQGQGVDALVKIVGPAFVERGFIPDDIRQIAGSIREFEQAFRDRFDVGTPAAIERSAAE